MNLRQLSQRSGLTLLEVILATCLAVCLMAALSGVIRRLEHQQQALVNLEDRAPWKTTLQRQLQQDLQNGRSLVVRPDGLTIYGYGGRDWQSGELMLRPTEVVYRTEWQGELPVLVREELELNQAAGAGFHRELAAVGVGGVRIGRLEDSAQEIAAQLDSGAPLQATAVPSRLRVVLLDGHWKIVLETPVFQPGQGIAG